MSDISREYPYLPEGREILYVPEDNEFMQAAKEYALSHSEDRPHPTGAVAVLNGEVFGRGGNFHGPEGCERKKLGIPKGEGFELCEGCSYKNHGERQAVDDAKKNGKETQGADVYLWGHWWCCKPCWDAMIEAGIKNVYLLERSWELFDI